MFLGQGTADREPIIATAGLALLAAGCGGSAGSHVEQLGSTTAQPASSSGASDAGGSTDSQPLAFSRCMRAHGVSKFPDPSSSGVWPKSDVEFAAGSPRFDAATRACQYLLPDGGPGVSPSPAVLQEIRIDMARFARCMRSRGVTTWPDPSLDRGREIFDPGAAGIDPNSPQILTKMHECERVFPQAWGIRQGRRGVVASSGRRCARERPEPPTAGMTSVQQCR